VADCSARTRLTARLAQDPAGTYTSPAGVAEDRELESGDRLSALNSEESYVKSC
jgi:hypothetical protein